MIDGATKMPEPITLPTMRVVASRSPRPRTSCGDDDVAAGLWAMENGTVEYNPAAPRDGLRLRAILEPIRARAPGGPGRPLRIQETHLSRPHARAVGGHGRGAGEDAGLRLHGGQVPEADQAPQAGRQLSRGRPHVRGGPALSGGGGGLPRGRGVPR